MKKKKSRSYNILAKSKNSRRGIPREALGILKGLTTGEYSKYNLLYGHPVHEYSSNHSSQHSSLQK